MNRSSIRTLVVGATLVAVTNAVALVGVAYNRGESESVLTLSERELWLASDWWLARENSGIALELRWRMPHEDYFRQAMYPMFAAPGHNWLNKAKLATLGFDMSPPEDTPQVRRHYERLLPKDVLLVLGSGLITATR